MSRKFVFRRLWPMFILALALALIAPLATWAAPAPSAAYHGESTYVVRYGDSLSQIAVRFGVSMTAIMQRNGLYNPDHIYVGQLLHIPGAGGSCRAYHTVKYGDTLFKIAAWYGVDVYGLAAANKMTNLNHIYTGQSLCIPGGYASPPPAPAPAPSQGFWYTVNPGDTVGKIALRYGVNYSSLVRVNGLTNPNHITIGQRLWIPGYNAPPRPPHPQPHPQPQPQPSPAPATPWTGLYYNSTNLSGSPVLMRQESDINFNWGTGSPSPLVAVDNFSVLWTSRFYFSGGSYRFLATVDDGVRVYVDDKLVIDSWRVQPATNYFADMSLSAGYHDIRVEYFEEKEAASIYVRWMRL